MTTVTRRDFLKTSLGLAAGVVAAPLLKAASPVVEEAAAPLLEAAAVPAAPAASLTDYVNYCVLKERSFLFP